MNIKMQNSLRSNLVFLSIALCAYFMSEIGYSTAINIDCSKNKKCYECIQTTGCKWCSDEDGELQHPGTYRCYHRNETKVCRAAENPESKLISKVLDVSASASQTSKFSYPGAKVQMRKGDKLNLTVEYTDERDRPLDLYILMDLSCTMKKHINKVERLADALVKTLKGLTKDMKLGFGSFVDKPITPYASSNNATERSTADKCGDKYVDPTYSFKNHLSLVSDVSEFKKAVNNANPSSNIDAPEGGLDALMQAIVCSEEIGWRTGSHDRSRRIIVLSTDETFHLAGDGKLAGIMTPNDGECHLENKKVYTHSTKQDYPSVSQIKDKLEKHDIYVIFAVTKLRLSLYEMLAKELVPFSVAQEITNSDSSNSDSEARGSIIGVIQDEYKKLVGTVNLQAREQTGFKIKYYAKCKPNGNFEARNNCTQLEPGSKMTFIVEVELKECPKNEITTKTLEIRPSLGSHDVFKIEVDMHCGCSCEKANETTRGVSKSICKDHGFLQCGICKCHESWGGRFCECSSSTPEGQANVQATCFKREDDEPCSGRGQCDCGECKCNKNATESYSGLHCECNDFGCERDEKSDKGYCNSEAGQGKCGCDGKCVCYPNFKGSRCECPVDDSLNEGHGNCKDPGNEKLTCNGHGTCNCDEGKVQCKCPIGKGYTGKYCELQTAKGTTNCKTAIQNWQSCIKCLTLDNRKKDFSNSRLAICEMEGKCAKVHPDFRFLDRITRTDIHPEIKNFEFDDKKDCRGSIKDAEQCDLYFIISDKNIHTEITKIFTEKQVNKGNCPVAAPAFTIAASVVGATLLIGIVTLLIWKVLTHIHDKREFARFDNERNAAEWSSDVNRLYKPVVSEFKNPAYSEQ